MAIIQCRDPFGPGVATVEELDPVEGWVTIASLEPGLGQEPDMWASVPSTSCMALVQVNTVLKLSTIFR